MYIFFFCAGVYQVYSKLIKELLVLAYEPYVYTDAYSNEFAPRKQISDRGNSGNSISISCLYRRQTQTIFFDVNVMCSFAIAQYILCCGPVRTTNKRTNERTSDPVTNVFIRTRPCLWQFYFYRSLLNSISSELKSFLGSTHQLFKHYHPPACLTKQRYRVEIRVQGTSAFFPPRKRQNPIFMIKIPFSM